MGRRHVIYTIFHWQPFLAIPERNFWWHVWTIDTNWYLHSNIWLLSSHYPLLFDIWRWVSTSLLLLIEAMATMAPPKWRNFRQALICFPPCWLSATWLPAAGSLFYPEGFWYLVYVGCLLGVKLDMIRKTVLMVGLWWLTRGWCWRHMCAAWMGGGTLS